MRGHFLRAASKGLWTPTRLGSSLKLWLDASDASTFTLEGSTVTQWNDKSGNAYHFSQSVSAAKPAYSAGVVTFDGVDDVLSVASRLGLAASPNLSIVEVSTALTHISSNGTDPVVSIGTAPFANPAGSIATAVGSAGYSWRYNNGNRMFGSASLGVAEVRTWHRASGSDYGSGNLRINGTAQSQTSTANPTFVPSSTVAYANIGGGYDTAGTLFPTNIAFREVIIAETNTQADYEKLEGYAAWKNGLVSTLAAGHPYKSAPPTL